MMVKPYGKGKYIDLNNLFKVMISKSNQNLNIKLLFK
jgi:hypothetical protein